MSRISPARWALLGLEVQAAACYLWLAASNPRTWPRLPVCVLLVGTALFGALALCSRALARRTGENPGRIAGDLIVCLSPLVLLDFVFIQYLVFLKDVRPVLGPVSTLASLSLLVDYVLRFKDARPDLIPARLQGFPDSLADQPKKTFRFLVAASFAVYVFLASGVLFPPQPFTGDEPHYLLITKSLLKDGDIDVFNNYSSEDYLDFYPGRLDSHAYPGRRGPEHTYSKHLPGISVLLVPAYAAGEIAGKALAGDPARAEKRRNILIFVSRLPMTLLAALLGGLFFLLVLEISGKAGPSLLSWLVFSFAPPLVFYSHLIYPEVPVAIVAILIFRSAILKQAPPPGDLLLAGAGISLIPWFGVKYVMLAAVLFVLCGLSLTKTRGRFRKRAISLMLFPVLSGAAYIAFFRDIYGKVSLWMPYTGIQQGTVPGLPPYPREGLGDALRFGLGFLFDQRYGLLPYAPVLILCFVGAIILFRKNGRAAWLLLGLFVPYWALCALADVWGGFCPPGRLLLPVAWVVAIFTAMAFAMGKSRLGRVAIASLVAMGFLITLAGLKNPSLLYNEHFFMFREGPTVYGRLAEAFSNSFANIKTWVPSFSSWEVLKRPALYVWLAIAGGLTGLFAFGRERTSERAARFQPGTVRALVFGIAVLIIACTFFGARLENPFPLGNSGLSVYAQDANNHGMESGGFWTRSGRETCIIVRSPRPLASLSISLSSPIPGKATVAAGMSEQTVTRPGKSEPARTAEFPSPVGFRWKGSWLYNVRVRDSAGFVPSRLDHDSTDGRPLGVLVGITGR